jgi:hypothetical protein
MRRRFLTCLFLTCPTLIIFLLCISVTSRAGGPAFIAGSGYSPGVEGMPIIWASGSVQYFTDQGDLSPILPSTQADAFVANAFSTWTSIASVAITASQAGHLAEDVNGSNIVVDSNGLITAPTDLTPSATATPVGIVYDYDGSVTEALLGTGAGGLADCFTNAAYGGPDNFSPSGNILHAFVVINGVCAATSAQFPDVQYRLVRVLARVLGLGWSQANVNVITQNPAPTAADFAGFPVMHYADPISCVPISACYPNAAAPKMDDITALSRLYPVSPNPQPTGRIFGSVYFTDTSQNALQPMQGVNVVARLIDGTGKPSRQYVVTSVSGFSFHGNAGNIVDGYVDANGLRYDRWGSNDPSLEGYFDLGQLAIPTGQTIAEYQLSVEPLDSRWSLGVASYAPTQVAPSGVFAPVVVTIQSGSNVERDILMLQNEFAQPHPGSGSTYTTPVALPQGGAWGSWISGYASTDFFAFTAQANRTASISVMALDETGQPTETKLLPIVGIWQFSDLTGNPAPASTPSAFNSGTFGMTRLDAQFNATDKFKAGIVDYRGDGRPDYFYRASLLYSDTVTPARVSVAGGVATLSGIGFSPTLQVTAGGNHGTVLSASAKQLQIAFPSGAHDEVASIQVTDPTTGAFSQMIEALTYGASVTDLLLLLQGAEPATPIGSEAAYPIRVRAVAADGVSPVNGATVAWSATNGLQFSACNGASSCSVLSDEAGESASLVTPVATGASTITIALAPASYSTPQTQLATVVGTSSTLDLVAETPTRWVAQGATVAAPLTVETLHLGVPKASVTVNFVVTRGSATLSAASATTNAAGFATVTAQITNQNAGVQVSACVAPNNMPCQTFNLFSTPPSLWTLETVSGSSQFVLTAQSFQPLVMRITDGSLAANPVMGVNVTFETTLARISTGSGGPGGGGDSLGGGNGLPVILGSSQAQVATDQNGLASIVPSAANVGPCDVLIQVSAGQTSIQFQMENLAAIVVDQPQPGHPKTPTSLPAPVFSSGGAPGHSSPALLFAVPESSSLSEPAPSPNHCSGDGSGDGSADAASCEPVSESPQPRDESLSPADPPVVPQPNSQERNSRDPKKAIEEAQPLPKTKSGKRLAAIGSPDLKDSHEKAVVSSLREDRRRNCRALAGDGLLF